MKKLLSVITMAILFSGVVFANEDEKKPLKKEADKDIVDLAVGTDILSTLVAAVKAGDLVDILKGDGPFTVFAPTNEAFAKLPAGTVESLLKPENKAQLVKVLTYHVVAGKVKSTDLKDGMEVETVQGQKIKIMLKDGKAMINDATVTSADIEATNGVVHVIDTVILPEM
ncbi:MAG: fasciclin domain-containing protein [Cyclobacteriaceae bacterium]